MRQRVVGDGRASVQPQGRHAGRPERARSSSGPSWTPQVLEDAREQAGDLHLRDPDGLRDLALGQPVEEPHLEDAPVTIAQPSYDGPEDDARLCRLHGGLVGADQVAQGGVPVPDRPVEGGGGEAALSVHGLEHLVDLFPQVLGQLSGGGRPTEPERQLGLGAEHTLLQLLDASRWTDHPPLVAEVPSHLAADGRHAERQEGVTGGRVESLSGLGQGQVGDLLEVLQRDAARAVARGDGRGRPACSCRSGRRETGALVLVGAGDEQLDELVGARGARCASGRSRVGSAGRSGVRRDATRVTRGHQHRARGRSIRLRDAPRARAHRRAGEPPLSRLITRDRHSGDCRAPDSRTYSSWWFEPT